MCKTLIFIATTLASVLAGPAFGSVLEERQDTSPTNEVTVVGTDNYCLIVPKDAHTNIGDSEYPGGETTYCTAAARTSQDQGLLSDDFWRNVEFMQGNGVNGASFVQLTGCINPGTLDRLNPSDTGGQYDSNGGPSGQGNPMGSKCIGYNSYVELIEPAGPRACIRCCTDAADCPTTSDTAGCPNVIPGNYFNCA
ncbi:hypothetical protein AX17_005999 [Amanita inopinata Kibby_2008]|nr:hypothetical protein AX17_005999 [Amanita inopinata Kibby_2008]